MSPLFRLISPWRPSALNPLRQTKLSPTFFQPSQSIGLRNIHGGLKSPRPLFQHVFRRRFSKLPFVKEDYSEANNRVIYGFIAVNVGIFGYGMYVKEKFKQGDRLPWGKFYNNFTLHVRGIIQENRYWTIITAAFSHLGFMHIFSNVFSFYFLAQYLAKTPGFTPNLLTGLVMSSAVVGSCAFLATKAMGGPRDWERRGLGFSGAVMGVGSMAACFYPKSVVHIWGIIPVPLWACIAGYLAYDGYHLQKSDSRVGHAGHLGGMATGFLFAFMFRRLRPGGGITIPRLEQFQSQAGRMASNPFKR